MCAVLVQDEVTTMTYTPTHLHTYTPAPICYKSRLHIQSFGVLCQLRGAANEMPCFVVTMVSVGHVVTMVSVGHVRMLFVL